MRRLRSTNSIPMQKTMQKLNMNNLQSFSVAFVVVAPTIVWL